MNKISRFTLLALACFLTAAIADQSANPQDAPRFEPYLGNPILKPGGPGEWDAGALGSMSVLKVGDTYHMYYEAWGVRGNDPKDYHSLQIGHATSSDGIHWVKDPANPVLPKGTGQDWDRDGTWDPFVIHEDGIFKMWYGGGMHQCDWGYATSTDGVHFEKHGQISQLGAVEDDHVIHDPATGRYAMYYWDRKFEPKALRVAWSPNEKDFDFANAQPVEIEGVPANLKYKFTHVFQEGGLWNMFFGRFQRPGCKDCWTGYATSSDGVKWQAQNANVLLGIDGEILKVGDDLYHMYYGRDGYFDQKDGDIRLATLKGKLESLSNPLK